MAMTKETEIKAVKNYLAQVEKMDRLINRLVYTVDDLRRSLTSFNYTLNPDKVLAMTPKDRIGDTTVKMVDLQTQIDGYIDVLIDRKRDALERICKVPDFFEQEILVARYIQLKRLEDIAEEIDKSTRWVFKLHHTALGSFAKYNRDILSVDQSV